MTLTCYTGESKLFRIPLRLDGADLFPEDEYVLTFTVKDSPSDPDSEAHIQKRTDGFGIEVSTHYAMVELVHVDTAGDGDDIPAMPEAAYYWDIQAQLIASPYTVRQVNRGIFDLKQAITRGLDIEVPIHTTNPPIQESSVANAIHSSPLKATPVDADEFGIADSASSFSLKKLSWVNIKTTLKAYFDTLYATASSLSGYVPITRTVNGHALSGNVTVTKGDVGLGNADNTADLAKPISTLTQAGLDMKPTVGVVAILASDIDWSAGSYFTKNLTSTVAFTFSDVQVGKTITVQIGQSGAGLFFTTWPAGIVWDGAAPSGGYFGKTVRVQLTATSETTFRGVVPPQNDIPLSVALGGTGNTTGAASSVSNATVNAAIAEDPAASRAAMVAQKVILGPFADADAAWAGGVAHLDPYKLAGGFMIWMDYDSDATAYAALVGLSADQIDALSSHIKDIKALALTPKEMLIGGSGWKARSGAALRAVIGNDGVVTGTIAEDEQGQIIPGTVGNNYIKFNNPHKSATLSEIGLFAVTQSAVSSSGQAIFGGYTSATRGPQIYLNASPNFGVFAGMSGAEFHNAASSGLLGWYSNWAVSHGTMMPMGASAKVGDATIAIYGNGRVGQRTNTLTNIYNDGTQWGFGVRPDDDTGAVCKMGYGLVTAERYTPAQYTAIINSGVKYGVFSVAFTGIAIGFGDSVMEGTSGSENEILQKLVYYSASGWNPSYTATNCAGGGTGIDSFETDQKAAAAAWIGTDQFAKRVIWFGSHNDADIRSSSAASREALCNRYLAVLEEYRAAGCEVVVISPIENATWSVGELANLASYRTYLASRCAALGFEYVNIFGADTGFSAAARNPAYFMDNIHLTAAGNQRVVDLLVAQIPTP